MLGDLLSAEAVLNDQIVGMVDSTAGDHGRIGQQVEVMIDSGSTATACGPHHFVDAPIHHKKTLNLKTASGVPLKHYG